MPNAHPASPASNSRRNDHSQKRDEAALTAAKKHSAGGAVTPSYGRWREAIAERTVQLGGEPDVSPDTLLGRSHADCDPSADLKAMVRANRVAERVAVEAYRQMMALIGDSDRTSRRMPASILNAEEDPAGGLKDMLET